MSEGKIRVGNSWEEPKGELRVNQRIVNGMVYTRTRHPDVIRDILKQDTAPIIKVPWWKKLINIFRR